MDPEVDPSLLDQYGRCQRLFFLLLAIPLLMHGYRDMTAVIIFVIPDHRCRLPELSNDTYVLLGADHEAMVHQSIPVKIIDGEERFSRCELYSNRTATNNRTTGENATEACHSWVYDHSEFDNTIATQFDLVCDKKGFRATYNMMQMLGTLLGSLPSGILCDRFGRKKVLIYCFVVYIVIGIATAFPFIPQLLLVCSFLKGLIGITLYLAIYVLCVEFVGPSHRAFAGSMVILLWLVGPFVLAGLAFLITDWRYLMLLGCAPFLLCLGYLWWIPESPRWLLSKNRVEEAKKVLVKVAKLNKLSLSPGQIYLEETKDSECATEIMIKDQSQLEEKEKMEVEKPDTLPSENLLGIFKYPRLILRTAIIFFNWAVVSTTYYGLNLNVPNLWGSPKGNFLLSISVELLGYLASWALLNRLGRKRLHCAAMILAGVACLATIFSSTFGNIDQQWVTIALAMLGKMGVSASFNSIYLMTSEMFPTVIRNSAVGCSSSVARIGNLAAPYIADIALYVEGSFGQAMPLITFGALAMVAGLLALCLPETLHRALPDTLLQAANLDRATPRRSNNGTVQDQPAAVDTSHQETSYASLTPKMSAIGAESPAI